MKRRRVISGGALTAVVVVLLVIVLAAVSSNGRGPSAGGSRVTNTADLARIRAHNIRLQEVIVLLKERQVRGLPTGSAPSIQGTPDGSRTQSASPAAVPSGGEAAAESGECDSNYQGACLDPNASDYDCAGGSGNGPDYTGEVVVVGEDQFGLDADGDGIGCEAE